MNTFLQEFATRTELIRCAIAAHQEWIETKLGVSLSEAVIFDGLDNLSQVGLDKILSIADARRSFPAARRLRTFTASAELPPPCSPIVAVRKQMMAEVTVESLLEFDRASVAGFEWTDCPIAFNLHYYNTTIVAMNLRYHPGPGSEGESAARVLIARRDCATRIAELIDLLHSQDQSPRLHTLRGRSRRIAATAWEDSLSMRMSRPCSGTISRPFGKGSPGSASTASHSVGATYSTVPRGTARRARFAP
jgi:hypothetical protein